MTDPHPGKARNPAGNSRPNPRHRYILRVILGYAVFGALWIYLSDFLLSVLVDVTAIYWLSTAKGLLFIVVTTLLLAIALRGVPGEAPPQAVVPRLELLLAASPGRRAWLYGFAVAITSAILLVRSAIAVSFGERPLLIILMFPVILSAMAGGLGPGLVATLLVALGAAHCLPPVGSFFISQPHDLFSWSFLVASGVLVSILAEMLHRLHRHSEASLQLQAVTLASIGDGVITTDTRGRISFMNHEAELLTGWTSGEATGHPLATVFRLIDAQNRQPLESPVDKVMVSGQVVELSSQALLLCRDGREVPVVDCGAPIRLGDGALAGVVLVFRDDSKRRQAEMILRQERGFLKTLIRTLPDLVWLKNPDGVYLACNARFERCVGAREAEIIGKSDYDFVDRELADFFRQKDREVIAKGSPLLNEEEITYADDGHRELLETIKTPMYDAGGELIGVLGLARDVTASRQAENALRESEATYRSLFENMLNSVSHCRVIFKNGVPVDLEYLAVNPAFAVVTGISEPVAGRRISEVIPGYCQNNPESMEMFGSIARSGIPARWEHYLMELDRWFSFSIYSPAGEEVIIVAENISERKKTELALRESLAEKVALLKEVHHRVKNNLQIVVSLLNLQAERIVNPEAVAALLDTINRVRSMALLHEVLYRSDNLARINLTAYLGELCLHLQRSFGQALGRVQVEKRVAAISLPLEQAVPCGLLINELVTNALKYGFPDGKTGRVLVEVVLDDGQITLAVSDNGAGLPQGFDPFASSTLGLQLVTNLAGQLGGSLEWEQGSEGGALFKVRFPAPGVIEQGDVP
ncbi:MAG: PAS domain-containing protein [Desulfurivibrionaceae bacterium]